MRRRLMRTAVRARAALPMQRRHERRGPTSDSMHNAAVMRWDSVAMGVVNTASTYLPVLVARLGGSAFAIGLLTAIPAVAGFALAIPIGHYLQRRGNAVVWYSVARFVANLTYVLIAVTILLLVRLYRRPYARQELSPVTRQHIELFQGAQLSEEALETTK